MRMLMICVMGMALGSCVSPAHRETSSAKSRPNVLLIFTDDQGYADASCYGGAIPTPHMDSLAHDGARFTQWYAASSICTPSRFGLLTGRYPSRSRDRLLGPLMFLEGGDKQRGIHPNETTIAQVLGESGYRTALIGKWHLGHGDVGFLPTRHGFKTFYGHTGGCVDYFTMRYGITQDWYRNETYEDTTGYATDVLTEDAVKFLEARRGDDQPFFLYLAYNAPHFAKGWDVGRQQTVNCMQPRGQDMSRVRDIADPIRAQYAAMVLALDDGVGRVLEALERSGHVRDTLVIFMSDNGGDPDYGGSNAPLRGEKATLFEGGIRVPGMMRWPGRIAAGSVVESPTGGIDLFPTLCALAGIDAAPYQPDGIDLSPWILKGKPIAERELLFELHTASALRQGRWKLLRTKAGEEMLFDLVADPSETTNRASQQPEDVSRMKRRLDQLLAQTKASS